MSAKWVRNFLGNCLKGCILHHDTHQLSDCIGDIKAKGPSDKIYGESLFELVILPLPVDCLVSPTTMGVDPIVVDGISNEAEQVKKLNTLCRAPAQFRFEKTIID